MKKNVLIISKGVGSFVASPIYISILNELTKYYNIDLVISSRKGVELLSPDINCIIIDYLPVPSFFKKILIKTHIVRYDGYYSLSGKIQSLMIKTLKENPLDKLWAKKIARYFSDCLKHYSLVFSFMNSWMYSTVVAGEKLRRELNTRWAIYSVDAIPTPVGWIDKKMFEQTRKYISRFYTTADALFFSNSVMAEYERKTFKIREEIIVDALLQPSTGRKFVLPPSESHIFLYTGSLQGKRTPHYLFQAFKRIHQEYCDAKLCFVGTRQNGFSEAELKDLNDDEREDVLCYPRANDLQPYYESSCCLIDIDGDITEDPFLSSKVTNYIKVNRPIICETGACSASRQLFNGLETIYLCNHNAEEIYKAMKQVVTHGEYNYEESEKIIEKFSIKSVISRLISQLDCLL